MNALLLFAAVVAASPPQEGSLHCPAPVAARGEVKGGPPLVQTFDLIHRGTEGTITITKVESGCGCIRRNLAAGILQPGATTRIALEINTLTQPDGPNRWQTVVSYSHDIPGKEPRKGELVLAITANLSREVSVAPAQVGFSTTGEAAQELTITDRRDKPLTILRAAGSSPHLTAEIGPPTAGDSGMRVQKVRIKLAADAPPGHRDEAVVLLTDDADYPEFRIPVRVLKRAAGGVQATPSSVAVRLGPGQSEVSTLVQLRRTDGKHVAIESAASDNPAVAVKWSPGANRVAVLRITITAAKPGECVVRVRFAEPAAEETVIPVSWK
jgi:hypothetical protein